MITETRASTEKKSPLPVTFWQPHWAMRRNAAVPWGCNGTISRHLPVDPDHFSAGVMEDMVQSGFILCSCMWGIPHNRSHVGLNIRAHRIRLTCAELLFEKDVPNNVPPQKWQNGFFAHLPLSIFFQLE